LKFWITGQDEIIPFSEDYEHYDIADDYGVSYGDAFKSDWIRGGVFTDDYSGGYDYIFFNTRNAFDPGTLRRISNLIDKIPGYEKADRISIEDFPSMKSVNYIPIHDISRFGIVQAVAKTKRERERMKYEGINKILDSMIEQEEPGAPSEYGQDWEHYTDQLSEIIDALQEASRKPGFSLSNVDIVIDHLQQALNLMVENY
jgi:hypothetical protein